MTNERSESNEEMELLGEYEGVEVYKHGDGSVYLTSEAIREGEDGLLLTYDALQELAVEHRDELESTR